jgi:hypothetical protein
LSINLRQASQPLLRKNSSIKERISDVIDDRGSDLSEENVIEVLQEDPSSHNNRTYSPFNFENV